MSCLPRAAQDFFHKRPTCFSASGPLRVQIDKQDSTAFGGQTRPSLVIDQGKRDAFLLSLLHAIMPSFPGGDPMRHHGGLVNDPYGASPREKPAVA